MKTAIITGITGQDGSYLAELLLNKDYQVIGCHRRSSINNFERVKDLIKNPRMILEEFDITDPACCYQLINKYRPDELYNLAAQSHVATSFNQPCTTFQIDTIGVVNLLESIKSISKDTKFYQASTSEMFGKNYNIDNANIKFQDENTELLPQSPYGIAKMASHRMVQIYREAYGIYACSGILFNHESPRRGENFVTRKITKYIGSLINGHTTDSLKLGNLNASRDWGHAKDYVYAMYLMLQADIPDDFVICTGSTHTVLDFLKKAFQTVNLNYKDHVEIDQDLFRPAEVSYLRGKNDKAKTRLGWEPTISFDDLVKEMVMHDIEEEKMLYV
jgi:GDPmannose 4,6-dehydratase